MMCQTRCAREENHPGSLGAFIIYYPLESCGESNASGKKISGVIYSRFSYVLRLTCRGSLRQLFRTPANLEPVFFSPVGICCRFRGQSLDPSAGMRLAFASSNGSVT